MTLTIQEVGQDLWRYPDELEEIFTATDGITFSDGHIVSSKDIWRFLTQEAPKRFPHEFNRYQTGFLGSNTKVQNRLRRRIDVTYLGGLKTSYLVLTLKDRVNAARKRGTPIVFVQGAQPVEPYFAGGGIPLRPQYVGNWARDQIEGLNLRQSAVHSQSILEAGRRTSPDACGQVSAHAAVEEGLVDIDLVAPIICLRCSDMAYLTETHRSGKKGVPSYLVDYPLPGHNANPTEERVELLTAELKGLVEQVSKLSGRKVTDRDLTEEIKLENKTRRLERECMDIWWNAKNPPTNSEERGSILPLAGDGCGDFVAATNIVEQIRDELKDRVKSGVNGLGLVDDPVRLFTCGSCVGPNPIVVDQAGGVIVGRDDGWSKTTVDVEEKGDPYENLARAILTLPYELPTEQRAEWIADQAKKSRADGIIFLYAWGCNYQTAVARMIADIVKDRTGLPSTTIELEHPGEISEQSSNRVESFVEILR